MFSVVKGGYREMYMQVCLVTACVVTSNSVIKFWGPHEIGPPSAPISR